MFAFTYFCLFMTRDAKSPKLPVRFTSEVK